MTLPSQTRCNLFSLAVLSWQGGGQFKVLLNGIYANDHHNDNNNDGMVTHLSHFRKLAAFQVARAA